LVFESGNVGSLRMSSLQGEYAYGLCFEEEYIDIPTSVKLLIQEIVLEEQILAPQDHMSFKRSTREKRNTISNNILYLFRDIRLTLEWWVMI
jgi:hypothetical protein